MKENAQKSIKHNINEANLIGVHFNLFRVFDNLINVVAIIIAVI